MDKWSQEEADAALQVHAKSEWGEATHIGWWLLPLWPEETRHAYTFSKLDDIICVHLLRGDWVVTPWTTAHFHRTLRRISDTEVLVRSLETQ
jgi:hypothetical protein